MSKHTPGPWRIGTPGPNGCYTVGTERGLMTAMVAHSINEPDQKEQAIADAALISAAPELLEALEYVMDRLVDKHETDEAAVQARAAIVKARGL